MPVSVHTKVSGLNPGLFFEHLPLYLDAVVRGLFKIMIHFKLCHLLIMNVEILDYLQADEGSCEVKETVNVI